MRLPVADPAVVAPFRVDPGAADRDAQALAAVRALVPGWAEVGAAAVVPLTGGITNQLLRVRSPGAGPGGAPRADVLVRIYGPRTEVVIDRARENRIFARLAAEGLAPPYLGRFENGRCEGFLDGFRPLSPDELGSDRWRRPIARELARLHALAPLGPRPRTFETLAGWLAAATDSAPRLGPADQRRVAALGLDTVQAARLQRLRSALDDGRLPGMHSPGGRAALRPVLAHNDLLSGNILVDDDRGTVRFIDFEYGDTGHAGFDLANHFCEHAGFDSDFARGFPGPARRHDSIAAWLGDGATPAMVREVDALVRFFVLVDHLWWGSWAVVQAAWSPIDFDFLGYAELRFAGFDHHAGLWGPLG